MPIVLNDSILYFFNKNLPFIFSTNLFTDLAFMLHSYNTIASIVFRHFLFLLYLYLLIKNNNQILLKEVIIL